MIDPSADRPVYHQVADDLREQISDGRLAAGAALRAESSLAWDYRVGQRTVRQALAVLEAEGLITRQAGRTARVREPADVIEVAMPAGARATVRRPSPAERQAHQLAPGELVVVVDIAGKTWLYPSDRVVLIADPG